MYTPVLAPKSFWDSSLGEQKAQEAAANHLGEWRDALFLEGNTVPIAHAPGALWAQWGGARRERARGGASGARPEGRREGLWAWLRLGAGSGGSRELGS